MPLRSALGSPKVSSAVLVGPVGSVCLTDSCSSSAADGANGSCKARAGGVDASELGVKARGVSAGLRRLAGWATLTDELNESFLDNGCRKGKASEVICCAEGGAGGSITSGTIDEVGVSTDLLVSVVCAGDSARKEVFGAEATAAPPCEGPKMSSKLLCVCTGAGSGDDADPGLLKKGFMLVDGAGLATAVGGGLWTLGTGLVGTGIARASSNSLFAASACRVDSSAAR